MAIDDGTIIENAAGERFVSQGGKWVPAPVQEAPGAFSTFARNTGASLMDTALNAPSNIASELTKPLINALPFPHSGMIDTPVGRLPGPSQIPGQITEGIRGSLRSPIDSNDIFAGAQLAGEHLAAGTLNPRANQFNAFPSPGMAPPPQQELRTVDPSSFQQAQGQQGAVTAAGNEANPVAAIAGDLIGPALLIAAGRSPGANARNLRANTAADARHFREVAATRLANRDGYGLLNRQNRIDPTLSQRVNKIFRDSSISNWVKTRFPRAAEAGVEGATMAILTEGDPVEVAGFSAGAQLGGSLMLSMASLPAHALGTKPGLISTGVGIALEAAAITAVIEGFQTFGPGETGEDMENTFGSVLNKMMIAMAAGVSAAPMGFGRISARDPQRQLLDAVASSADAITSIPRNTIFNAISDWRSDNRVEPVLRQIGRDPNAFGAQAQRVIGNAIDKGRSLTESIDFLEDNSREFRDKLGELQ